MTEEELRANSGDFEVGEDHSMPPKKEELELQILTYERDRAICEARKAELDFEQMKKPRWARAGWWLSAIATAAGVLGVGIQYTHSTRDLQLAEIQRERTELAREKAERAAADALALWKSYQDQIAMEQQRLVALKKEQEEIEDLVEASLKLIETSRDPDGNPIGPFGIPPSVERPPQVQVVPGPAFDGLSDVKLRLEKKRDALSAYADAPSQVPKHIEQRLANFAAQHAMEPIQED